jgi:hypothetical protein
MDVSWREYEFWCPASPRYQSDSYVGSRISSENTTVFGIIVAQNRNLKPNVYQSVRQNVRPKNKVDNVSFAHRRAETFI